METGSHQPGSGCRWGRRRPGAGAWGSLLKEVEESQGSGAK